MTEAERRDLAIKVIILAQINGTGHWPPTADALKDWLATDQWRDEANPNWHAASDRVLLGWLKDLSQDKDHAG